MGTLGSILPQARNSPVSAGEFNSSIVFLEFSSWASGNFSISWTVLPSTRLQETAVGGVSQSPRAGGAALPACTLHPCSGLRAQSWDKAIALIVLQVQQPGVMFSGELVQCFFLIPLWWDSQSEEEWHCVMGFLHRFLCRCRFVLQECALLHPSPTEVKILFPARLSQARVSHPGTQDAFLLLLGTFYSLQ